MKVILLLDAVINFFLAVVLLLFGPAVIGWFGLPPSSTNFYPNILGAVFLGITIALVLSVARKEGVRENGLGVLGAIAINLCGGTVLALWLLLGQLGLPLRGTVILWALVGLLVLVSTFELLRFAGSAKRQSG